MNSYRVGGQARLRIALTDYVSGDPVDAGGTLSITIQRPDGTTFAHYVEVDEEVSNPSTGVYLVLINIPLEERAIGIWSYFARADGDARSSGEGQFKVLSSTFV